MRNINCSEERECTLEKMSPIIQTGGGGLVPGEEDYVVPFKLSSTVKRVVGKQVGRGKPRNQVGRGKAKRQIGRGKKVIQKGKGRLNNRKCASRTKKGKRASRKNKRQNKSTPWTI